MAPRRLVLIIVAVLAVTAGLTAAGAVVGTSTGKVGPAESTLPNGRELHPAGTLTEVGNFPTGGALTPDGRFYWTVSTGRGLNDLRTLSVATGKLVQIVPIPGASGGIAMDPLRPIAYVSGVADSSHADQQRPALQGRGGDVVQVFRYDPETGVATFAKVIGVPPPAGSPVPQGVLYVPGFEGPPQAFPPTNTKRVAWPDRLAVSPDGSRLLVPLNLADHAAIVDTTSGAVRYVGVGHYPYGAAILPDGKTGLVSNESDGTVSMIDLDGASKKATIRVGPPLSHPEAIALDASGRRAFVAVTNADRVAVIDTASRAVEATISLDRPAGVGAAPVALAVHGDRLLVAEEGADDLAVIAIPKDDGTEAHDTKTFRFVGRIPTADFPADVQASASRLLYLSAKGLGVGPNPNGPIPTDPRDNDNQINSFSYLPSIVRGMVGMLPFPTDKQVRALTPAADAQIVPANAEPAPAGTPLRAGGSIKHVFYIVRENRTYDQILGDLGRGDGDPKLTLFGAKITPNLHALVTRFPLLDHVYANSEASIDGHFWTSAAAVPDYVHKNWMQNYGGRGRPYDFGAYSVSWPLNGFLFDQALRQGISWFNYGEAVAGVAPLPDKDRTLPMTAEVIQKFAHSDLGTGTKTGVLATAAGQCYPNDIDVETDAITQQPTYDSTPPAGASPLAESRFDCFKARFDQQAALGQVPAFNYLVLPNDHTVGTTPGKRSPQALIADNDYGLGQIVDLISHSSIWSSSAIFVVEDDSQDGADHVDAHRIPAAVVSPYTAPGAIVHTRYDFLSVIRSMELILGMRPLGLFDALATPMYDAFTTSPANALPYTAIVPAQDRMQLNLATAADAARSLAIDFSAPDQVDQRTLDAILWHAVHGAGSTPPPPGPGASANEGGSD